MDLAHKAAAVKNLVATHTSDTVKYVAQEHSGPVPWLEFATDTAGLLGLDDSLLSSHEGSGTARVQSNCSSPTCCSAGMAAKNFGKLEGHAFGASAPQYEVLSSDCQLATVLKRFPHSKVFITFG